MYPRSSLLFLLLPFAEIAAFIFVGEAIGVAATLALIILSMGLGLAIVRRQGLGHLGRLKSTLQAGEAPVADMMHTVLLMMAGILFIIPGFLTDILAILLLLPPVRGLIGLWVLRNMTIMTGPNGPNGPENSDIIEGEFTETGPGADPAPPQLPQNDRKDGDAP